MVFHPVLQEAEAAASVTARLLDAASDAGLQVIAVAPNSDAGSVCIFDSNRSAATVTRRRRA